MVFFLKARKKKKQVATQRVRILIYHTQEYRDNNWGCDGDEQAENKVEYGIERVITVNSLKKLQDTLTRIPTDRISFVKLSRHTSKAVAYSLDSECAMGWFENP